jgi:hypothetical protein
MKHDNKIISQLKETVFDTEKQIDTYRNRQIAKRQNKVAKRNSWLSFWKNNKRQG